MEDPCKGCMFRCGKGRNHICTVCSRMYVDRFKPEPPPKPLSRGAAMVLTAAAAIMSGSHSNPLDMLDSVAEEEKIRKQWEEGGQET